MSATVVEGSSFATSVVQVTNIAPQATRDQMVTLFSFVGRVEDVRLYPSVRDAGITVTSRCCFVKFADPSCVTITLHLNNTVFIDRAIIITPVLGDKVPEENEGLVMAMQVQQQQQQGLPIGPFGKANGNNDVRILAANPGLVSVAADGQISTQDAALVEADLPPYPLLPGNTPVCRVEEIRRTVTVAGLDSTVSAQQCMEFFAERAGEVKCFRYCTRESDVVKYALVEFTERSSVVEALNLNGSPLGTTIINVMHATQAIQKPRNKSNEAAQKEIEEAMSRVKEANCLVSAAVDPLMGMLGSAATTCGPGLTNMGRGGRSERSRSRGMSGRRSRSRGRRRRSRSRSRRRSRSRERSRRHRSRSRSKEKRKHRKSRSKSRDRRKRSRSRDKERHAGGGSNADGGNNGKKEERSEENGEKENGGKAVEGDSNSVAESGSGKRSRSTSRRRSKSRERRRRSRSRSRERKGKRAKSRERKRRRSRSRDRRRGSSRERRRRSKDRRRSRSRDKKVKKDENSLKKSAENKVVRDYDQEEAGFENDRDQKLASKVAKLEAKVEVKIESMETEDMEISNSP